MWIENFKRLVKFSFEFNYKKVINSEVKSPMSNRFFALTMGTFILDIFFAALLMISTMLVVSFFLRFKDLYYFFFNQRFFVAVSSMILYFIMLSGLKAESYIEVYHRNIFAAVTLSLVYGIRE